MILKPSQIEAFYNEIEKKIIANCLEFLKVNNLSNSPNISSEKDTVHQVLGFAQLYNIKKESNIQQILHLQAKYGFLNNDRLSQELKKIMSYPSRDEDTKLNHFHKQLIFENSRA